MYCLTEHHQLVLNGYLNTGVTLCQPSLLSKRPHWSLAKAVLEWVSEKNTDFSAAMPLAYLRVELGWPLAHLHATLGWPFIQVHVLVASFNFYNNAFALYTFPSVYLLLCIISNPSWESELRFLPEASN